MKIRKRIVLDKDTFAPILRYEVDFELEPLMDNEAKNREETDKDAKDLLDRLESFNPEMTEYGPTKLDSFNPKYE